MKQFNSYEDMQNSSNNHNGDLAVIYYENITQANIGDTMNIIYFPETVNFDEPVNTTISSRVPRYFSIFNYKKDFGTVIC